MAKGEIAHSEQFLLLRQCFQKLSAAEGSESVCMREMVNTSITVDLLFTAADDIEFILANICQIFLDENIIIIK